MQHFYFDYNATTPVAPEVRLALIDCLEQAYGNASSIHHFGQEAKRRMEDARRQVAAFLNGAPAGVVFTSGGTEADNLAVLGAARAANGKRHVVTSAIEHSAVLNACAQLEREGRAVTRVPVNADGVVSVDEVARAIRPDTALVSIMHANNELGTVQPVAEIVRAAHAAGALAHVDGVQAAGKIPVDVEALGVDLYSISGHKLYAPKGIGALWVRNGVRLAPLAYGGHHERDHRPGTENVPGIVALGVAAELAAALLSAESERVASLRDRFEASVTTRVPGATVNGAGALRTSNTSNIAFADVDGQALVIALDLRGFAVSTGSACSSGAVTPSRVLTAIGLGPELAHGSIRFSLGRSTTAEQVDGLVEAVADAVGHLRKVANA